MDIFIGLLGLTALAAICLVILVLFEDSWALRFAAILKTRVEARAAYKERHKERLGHWEQEFGIKAKA